MPSGAAPSIRSEQHLSIALGAADIVGIWDGDLLAGLVYGDANFARIYGMEPGVAAAGMPRGKYVEYIHPDDLENVRREMDRLYAGAPAFANEHRILHPDGCLRWVLARGRLVRDAAGQPVRFAGISVDITERKREEARHAFLLALADRLWGLGDPQAIMSEALGSLGRYLGVNRVGYGKVSFEDAAITIDTYYADGVKPVNGRFEINTFGAGNMASHMLGRTLIYDDILADPSQDPEIWNTNQTRAVVSVPLIRDGRFRATLFVSCRQPRAWLPEDVALIKEVAERTWSTLERARAETALREANELLEKRIASALAERLKIEDALRQSQKMEAVGQLTGGLAHDFNNLLTGISGSLELLQARIEQGRVAETGRYITLAMGAANRAAALTQRLLAFSRRQTLSPKPVEPNTLVAGMRDLIQQTAGPAIAVKTLLEDGLGYILCDPNQMENALLNLCVNARDAMPDGGNLTIQTRSMTLGQQSALEWDLSPGPYIAICVSDTGTGMPPEIAARAFDPFFTTKPMGQGTGLGLSMIYGFARQSGGQARIDSIAGKGTSVGLYLPRFEGEAEEAKASQAGTAAARMNPSEEAGNVLVVDDDPTVRLLIADMLKDLGYRVLEAFDSVSGLQLLQSKVQVDFVISDVGMPGGMNGRQMADAARIARPELKILFMTGYAESSVFGNGPLEPGMHVIAKPFSIEALAAKISALISDA